jgi:hypothetical protein
MTEGSDARGAPVRAEALDVLRDYGALHDAVRRLVELEQLAKVLADPSVLPNATTTDLYQRLCDLRAKHMAVFAELLRIDAALASQRCALLGEAPRAENVH